LFKFFTGLSNSAIDGDSDGLCGHGSFGVEDEGGGFRSLFGTLASRYSSEVRFHKDGVLCCDVFSLCFNKALSVVVCSFFSIVVWELEIRVGWKVTEGWEDGVPSSIIVSMETALSCLMVFHVMEWRMLVGLFRVLFCELLVVGLQWVGGVPFSRRVSSRLWQKVSYSWISLRVAL
jgi:hypothetical protein